jgi:hypothetical protein
MTDARRFERSWRRAVLIGIVVSVAAHAALLAWVRFGVDAGRTAPGGALVVVPLPETRPAVPERDAPLQVVELASPAGGSRAAAGPRREPVARTPRLAAIPSSLAMASRSAEPVVFLDALAEPEEEENPSGRYARVSDFLVPGSAEPGPFRPIDDRPVDVLARIGAGRGTGTGIGVGGGRCPPRVSPLSGR